MRVTAVLPALRQQITRMAICLTGLISIVSCEKTMFIDLDDSERRIVLNGILSPDYGLWLNVSESVGSDRADSYSYIGLPEATVTYYSGDELISTITGSNDGNYFERDFKPVSNHEYRIVVNSEGLPEASAVVKIPVPAEISSFDTSAVIRNISINDPSRYEVEFFMDFSFVDKGWEENFYMLGAFYWEGDDYQPLNVDSEDLNMNVYIQDGVEILAWNDHHFNGEKKEFQVSFRLYQYTGFETVILFTLYSIDEDYFKYLKTYSQNFTVLNDDPLLYEAVQVHSNIENGYGIIAGVASRSVAFGYTF